MADAFGEKEDGVLSVVIPTYNERDNIRELVERISSSLVGFEYEIVIVDDNSPDGTAMETRRLAREHPIKLVVRDRRMGLASAVAEGVKIADGDVIAVMDADLQHPPELLPRLYEMVVDEGCDIAVASRRTKGASMVGWSSWRRIISSSATLAARALLPEVRGIRDPLSGYFAYREDRVRMDSMGHGGFKVLLDLLVSNRGARICEVPYSFGARGRGKSKLSIKVAMDYLAQLMRLSIRTLKFATVGGSGVAVNLGVLASLRALGIIHGIAAAAAIEVSVLRNFAWNDMWTFRDSRSGWFGERLTRYHGATAAGLLTQYAVSVLLYWTLIRSSLLAQLVGIVAGFGANYLLSSSMVWKPGAEVEYKLM